MGAGRLLGTTRLLLSLGLAGCANLSGLASGTGDGGKGPDVSGKPDTGPRGRDAGSDSASDTGVHGHDASDGSHPSDSGLPRHDASDASSAADTGSDACPPAAVCNGQCCLAGAICIANVCACGGTTPMLCDGVCKDLAVDSQNCGGCGHACPPDVPCSGGACDCPPSQLCGGVCVDTSTDPNNCGTCGVVCGAGGLCVDASCHTVTTLDTNMGGPGLACALVLDASNVYWTEGGDIRSVARSGGPGTTLASWSGEFGGLAEDATYLYWTTYGDGTILRASKTVAGTPTTLAQGLASPSDIVGQGTKLYWLDQGGVLSMPSAPASIPSVFSPDGALFSAIATDSTDIYWGTSEGNLVRRPPGGGATTTVAPVTSPAMIAIGGSTVYYSTSMGGQNGAIFATSTAGGGAVTTLSTNTIGALAIDTGYVYTIGPPVSPSNDQPIIRLPNAGGTPVTIAWTGDGGASFTPEYRCLGADSQYVYWVDQFSLMRYSK